MILIFRNSMKQKWKTTKIIDYEIILFIIVSVGQVEASLMLFTDEPLNPLIIP